MIRYAYKPRHAIILLVGAVLLLIGILIARTWYNQANPIAIYKVPQDLTLYIDDKKITGGRTTLSEGTHAIRGEKEGFATYESQVLVQDPTSFVAVALSPESTEAKKWADANQSLYLEFEATVGELDKEEGERFALRNPIVTELPFQGYTFTIGYMLDQSDTSGQSIILTVDSEVGYRNAAVEYLYDMGYDPADYTIKFYDHTNPFREGQNNE